MRRVRPCRLMAWPITQAPRRKILIQLAQAAKPASTVRTPQNTSKAIEKNAVTGIGIGSQTHQTTVQRNTPRVLIPAGVTFSQGGRNNVSTNRSGPRKSPSSRFLFSKRTSTSDSRGAISAKPFQLMVSPVSTFPARLQIEPFYQNSQTPARFGGEKRRPEGKDRAQRKK